MKMKPILLWLLVCLSVGRAKEPAQTENPPAPARMVELLANPERFNGKSVTVIAYLVIGNRGVNADSALCLHREDWENGLQNCIGVVPSQNMHRNWRELNGMYVRITGAIVTGDPAEPEGHWIAIQDVKECEVWSDPDHPRALKQFPDSLKRRPGAEPK